MNGAATATTLLLALPPSILLLLHLHLLNYPFANKPEYDEHVFDSRTRGLRDRMKTLEDVIYFLVMKVEGGPPHAKVIFPTYPCLTPSDTTAFRMSATKYLETLRQSSIRADTKTSGLGAPWWKDTVVRKSLLEECSGERLERLLVALSTHALLKTGSSSSLKPKESDPKALITFLQTAPQVYAAQLATFQSARHDWNRAATRLIQRETDLVTLRSHISRLQSPSKFESLSTEKLLAYRDLKLHDLLDRHWQGETGKRALDALVDMTGFIPAPLATASDANVGQLSSLGAENMNAGEEPVHSPPPLPIAAAHHPTTLRNLTGVIFNPSNNKSEPSREVDAPWPPSGRLAELLDNETRMQNALQEALRSADQTRDELSLRLQDAEQKYCTARVASNASSVVLDLWTGDIRDDEHLSMNQELLSSFSHLHIAPPLPLDERVRQIRREVSALASPSADASPVPIYPSKETRNDAPGPVQESQRVSTGTTQTPYNAPKTPKRYITSTPPTSVKPRSTYARKALVSQGNANSVRRKSVKRISRKSTHKNVSLLPRAALQPRCQFDEEIDRIADAVVDTSSSPKNIIRQTPKANRIIPTSSGSTVRKQFPRPTFNFDKHMTGVSLPSFPSFEADDGESAEQISLQKEQQDIANEDEVQDGADEWVEEEPFEGVSLNLRDILVKAGRRRETVLLAEDTLLLADDSLGWD